MLATSSITGIGYLDIFIIIGKVAGAFLSVLGATYAIGRLKPLRILWRRNVTDPWRRHRERVVGGVVDAHIRPVVVQIAEATETLTTKIDTAASVASEARELAAASEGRVTKLYEIVTRELNPDHGHALVDKVDWLVQLHGTEGKSHVHEVTP